MARRKQALLENLHAGCLVLRAEGRSGRVSSREHQVQQGVRLHCQPEEGLQNIHIFTDLLQDSLFEAFSSVMNASRFRDSSFPYAE